MGVIGAEQQLCPCYKECQEFHKLVELKDGLVVYCHSTRAEDVRQEEVVETAVNISRDVFILHNTKNVKITPSDLTPELEKRDISCPRCRKIYEHAQELLKNVPSIDKKNVMSVCDNCRNKTQATKYPCYACEEIVRKCISVKGEQKEDTKKYIKIWLSKMGHLLKDAITLDKQKKNESRAYSDLQINRLLFQSSPASRREPEVQQMVYSEKHKSDTNLYTEMSDDILKTGPLIQKSVAFIQRIEPVEKSFDVTQHESEQINAINSSPLLTESDITFVETYVTRNNIQELPRTSLKDHKQGKTSEYYDDSSIDAKEAMKKRHDLSLRHMMRIEKDSGALYSASKRPEIYEIRKTAPWEKQNPTQNQYHVLEFDDESISNVKGATKRKHLSSRTSQKSLRDTYSDQFRIDKHDHSKIEKVYKQEKRYLADDELKLQRSLTKFSHNMEKLEQRMMKPKSSDKKAFGPKENVEHILNTQFSFFFPNGKEKEEKQIKLGGSSSQLIKNTLEKLRLQAQREKQRHEKERQQKVDEHEKKKQAREMRKQEVEDKKRPAVEDQKKYVEEQKRPTEGKTERDIESKSASEQKKKRREEEKRQEKSKEVTSKKGREKRDLTSEYELTGKTSKESEVAQKKLKHKTEPRDTLNKEIEKGKKDLKSKPEQRYEIDKLLEKTKKDFRSKPEQRNETDAVLEQAKKDLKSKPEQKDKIDEALEIAKKDVKGKFEPKGDEIIEKDKKGLQEKREAKETDKITKKGKIDPKERHKSKDKDDLVIEKGIKALKGKRESNGKDDEIMEKGKKGLKEPHILKDRDDEITVTMKSKKDLKPKTEQKDEIYEVVQKGQKYFLKPERKDKTDKSASVEKEKKAKIKTKDIDKEMTLALKQREKEERHETLQKNKEENERLKQVEQLRKEKEVQKKKAATDAEELSKKKLESSKEKEAPSKKTEKSSKENEGSPKKQEPSAEIKVSMSKIQLSSQETKEISFKQKVTPKEKKEKKQELFKEVEEPSKKKQDTSKEEYSKGKASKNEEVVKESKEISFKKAKNAADEAQFRKLQADHLKEKEEALKKKKHQEIDAQKAKELADKRAKEEAEHTLKSVEAKAVTKTEPKAPLIEESGKKKEGPKSDEIKIHDIKVCNASSDDLILRLVTLKQSAPGAVKIRPCDIDLPGLIKAHKCHQKSGQMSTLCALCCDSELEIDVESYDNKINARTDEITDIIIGEKIFKQKQRLEKSKKTEIIPILFQSEFREEFALLPPQGLVEIFTQETEPVKKQLLAKLLSNKDTKGVDPEPGRGIIRYALSDRTFIDKGWTMLPTEKVVRKMNVYRMRPAHPEFDWFEHNKNKRLMTYDTGERLAEFDDNGRGRWYYRNGRLALDYYDAEETNAQQRFVIYSNGEPDERGRTHPITILATFDYLGNGIVFDHAGKIRLKYNQTEGVILDRGIGPVSHWKWHTLNDPPVLQQVMIDTQMAHKDPEIIKLGTPADSKTRPDNEEMLTIEFDNFIKEKSKKLSQKFKPFQIKMKALKINEHFSLKVLDQATIYLIFRDGSTNLKLNIGMLLDHQEIVDTDTAEVGEVSNNLERFPARTDSLAGLQRSVAYAQRYERQRTERERRLRRPVPFVSADHLTAAASPPLRTMPVGSTSSVGYCNCRKPTNNIIYYNTRLL